MRPSFSLWPGLSLLLCASCAYPRHATLLNPVPPASVDSDKAPRDMYSLRLIRANTPPRKMSGLSWDDDQTAPDPFVRLYIDGRLVWESEVLKDQQGPQWETTLPRNIVVAPDSRFRLELWDYDTPVSADPMGHFERAGLPANALPGARARVQLDSQSLVELLVNPPVAHQGVGLTVEIHSDFLKVLKVEPYSPAARGGISAGDRIVAIGNDRVAHMSDDVAASELSLAVDRKHKLAVTGPGGHNERQVELEGRLVWLVM